MYQLKELVKLENRLVQPVTSEKDAKYIYLQAIIRKCIAEPCVMS